jgi:hypothetical protein
MTPTPFQSEFGGTPLAAGSTRGARKWTVDRLGRLIGQNKYIWRPGENLAICEPRPEDIYYQALQRITAQMTRTYAVGGVFWGNDPPPEKRGGLFRRRGRDACLDATATRITEAPEPVAELVPEPEPPAAPPPCAGAEPHCTCGFYAYYGDTGTVSDEYTLYEDTRSSMTTPKMQVPGVIDGYGLTTVGTKGFRAMKGRIAALHLHKAMGLDLGRRLRHNYPDVAFFDGRELPVSEMYRGYPPEPVDLPTPETDPDFWTRSAS